MVWEARLGLTGEGMMDNSQQTTKRVTEYTTGQMEEDMKAGGILINNMDLEFIREQVKVRQRIPTVKMMEQY